MWSRLHHSRTRSCSTATSAPPLTRPCTPRCRLMISGHRSDEQRRLNSTTMNMSTPVVGAARARAQEWPWLRARRVDAVNRSFRYRRSAPVSLLPPSRPRRCSPTHRTRRVLESQDDIEGHAHRGPCPVCQPLEGHQEVRRKPPILPDRCRASLKPRVSGAMPTALLTFGGDGSTGTRISSGCIRCSSAFAVATLGISSTGPGGNTISKTLYLGSRLCSGRPT